MRAVAPENFAEVLRGNGEELKDFLRCNDVEIQTITRGDGKRGRPLRADYLAAAVEVHNESANAGDGEYNVAVDQRGVRSSDDEVLNAMEDDEEQNDDEEESVDGDDIGMDDDDEEFANDDGEVLNEVDDESDNCDDIVMDEEDKESGNGNYVGVDKDDEEPGNGNDVGVDDDDEESRNGDGELLKDVDEESDNGDDIVMEEDDDESSDSDDADVNEDSEKSIESEDELRRMTKTRLQDFLRFHGIMVNQVERSDGDMTAVATRADLLREAIKVRNKFVPGVSPVSVKEETRT